MGSHVLFSTFSVILLAYNQFHVAFKLKFWSCLFTSITQAFAPRFFFPLLCSAFKPAVKKSGPSGQLRVRLSVWLLETVGRLRLQHSSLSVNFLHKNM